MLVRRPRSRLKTFARMRKRDKMFALWSSSTADPLVTVNNAVRFAIEEPLLEATPDEREALVGWHARTSLGAARQIVGQYPVNASALTRDDSLVRIATEAAIDIFAGAGLILFWQWVTQRDARVCSRCGPLNGRVMRAGEVARLPLHPRCRCGLRPFFR